jgi:Tat protein translocase TatB subunit
MFDLDVSKLAVIGAVALVVIGPEKMPRVARTVGTLLGKAQRYISDVKAEVNRSMEMEDLKKMKESMDTAMTDVSTRQPLGRTGIQVTRLGIGCGRLGALDDAAAWRLLDVAFAHGVRVIDVARSYGRAEALVGAWRKQHPAKEIVVSTKVGYGVAGVADWTAEAVARGIEEARKTLHSDVLDVVHLHSCPGHVACRDDIQRALEAARDSGHVAVIVDRISVTT